VKQVAVVNNGYQVINSNILPVGQLLVTSASNLTSDTNNSINVGVFNDPINSNMASGFSLHGQTGSILASQASAIGAVVSVDSVEFEANNGRANDLTTKGVKRKRPAAKSASNTPKKTKLKGDKVETNGVDQTSITTVNNNSSLEVFLILFLNLGFMIVYLKLFCL